MMIKRILISAFFGLMICGCSTIQTHPSQQLDDDQFEHVVKFGEKETQLKLGEQYFESRNAPGNSVNVQSRLFINPFYK